MNKLKTFSIENRNVRYFLYFILLLPIYFFRDFTPDNELRYLSIVDEALRNNTWVTFYNHGEVYADKPPLYFWLMMMLRKLFGAHYMATLGLISLIPAMLTVYVMDNWLIKYNVSDHKDEVLGGLMLLTTGFFLGAAFVIRMDMLMCLFIVLSLYTFYKMYAGDKSRKNKLLFVLYIFLGVFTKGPIGILMPMLSIIAFLVYQKEFKTLRTYFSVASVSVLILLFASWFAAIYLEGGSSYLNNILVKQTVGRGINSFHHDQPFYYYLKTSLFTFAPWSILYLVSIVLPLFEKRKFTSLEIFFLSIITASFVMFSLISSKLDIYLVPIYPFVAYFAAIQLKYLYNNKLVMLSIGIPAALFMLALPLSFFAKPLLTFEYDSLTFVYIALGVLFLGGLQAIYWLKVNKSRAIRSISVSLLIFVFVASFGVSQFNQYIGFEAMAVEAQSHFRDKACRAYAYYQFRGGENMDVFLKTKLQRLDNKAELDSFLRNASSAILFIQKRDAMKDLNYTEDNRKQLNFISKGDYYIVVIE